MPIYEYICNRCDAPFERLVRSARTKIACPECGSSKVTKQFSSFAAHQGSPASAPPCSNAQCPAGGGGECQPSQCPFS